MNSVKSTFRITLLSLTILLIIGLTACGGKMGKAPNRSDADSLYTWAYIKRIHITEPERSLALVDTAEQKKMLSPDSCDWIRALIHYGATEDYAQAITYCQRVIERLQNDSTSGFYLSVTSLLSTTYLSDRQYHKCLNTCMKGASLAHQSGNVKMEADFSFLAGTCMEHLTPGKGIHYMTQGIDLLSHTDDEKSLPNLSYYYGQKARYLTQLAQYQEAIEAEKERLAVIQRIERVTYPVPDGYIDEQYANVYSILAYCQQKVGLKAEAQQSVTAFNRTRHSKTPRGMIDIINYYALAGDATQVLQIYSNINPILQQKDTINSDYQRIVQDLAAAYRQQGDYRKADHASQRALTLADSINQREKQAETMELAQLYLTQEKELQLKDRAFEARIYRTMLVSILLILLFISWHLCRIYLYNKALREKNQHLYNQIQQQAAQEQAQLQHLQSQPEASLTQEQLIYRRLCSLMETDQPYTDENLNREQLAHLMGTNDKYVDKPSAIALTAKRSPNSLTATAFSAWLKCSKPPTATSDSSA